MALVGLLPVAGAWSAPAVDARIAAHVAGAGGPVAPWMAFPVDRAWIARVYGPAHPGPVWSTADGPRPDARVALRELRAAADRGLAPEDYAVDALEREWTAAHATVPEPEAIAVADLALTTAVLRFLSDLRFGRVQPQRVEPHFVAAPKDARFVRELRDAVAREGLAGLIAGAEPEFPQYARLKETLAQHRLVAERPAPDLPALPPPRDKVDVGDRYSGAIALRAALVRLGDLPEETPVPADERLAPSLAEGLRRFQARHGLEPDGVLGKDTLAALRVPAGERVRQIVLSLERLRWLPELPPGRLVAVNIPSFRLWALDAPAAAHPALVMPVVVGRAMRSETPVFIGEMRAVEFSPYWNVPSGILRRELLPRIARDPGWLAREDMEIVSTRGDPRALAADADGIAALQSGDARLRQRPGPRNALGGVKFVLPNTMDVYLHATPARELFARARRDFSHGCVRVGDPEALAGFVLEGQTAWTRAAIEAAMSSGTNRVVPLAEPVPVVIFYTTAIVAGDGRVHFLRDVYGHDRVLLAALRAAGRTVRPRRRRSVAAYQRRTRPVSRWTNRESA